MELYDISVENVGPFELLPRGKLFTAINVIAVLIPLEHISADYNGQIIQQAQQDVIGPRVFYQPVASKVWSETVVWKVGTYLRIPGGSAIIVEEGSILSLMVRFTCH